MHINPAHINLFNPHNFLIVLIHINPAGVFIPATETAIYVSSGGVGTSNTINRAELIGIASALRAKCTHTATDSACSLSQTRKNTLIS